MLGALPGDGHMALSMPVTDSAALRQAIAAVDQRHSRLDLLVNSAGITRFVPHGVSMRSTTRSSAASSMSTCAA
jgi:3-oxoacyl-[acyl-carrier protein] reductase